MDCQHGCGIEIPHVHGICVSRPRPRAQVLDIVRKAYTSITTKAGDAVEFKTSAAESAAKNVKKAAATVVEA